ncbi:MAG: TonB-dependent receptor, partial [Deltaproteobacteria bacterium]|nr:TonB-dependent receptor [Deltaproteobacteria bacterium]
ARYLLVANEWGSDHARLAIFVSFDGQEYTPGSGFGVVANALKTDDRLFGVSYRSQLEAWRFTVQPQFETIEMTGRLSSTNESKWWLPLSVGWSTFILDWSLSPGLVYHHVEYPGASRRYDLVSPRVVVKRQFRDWNFASTLGSYFRHPTMAELYGQPQVLVGNSALKPERSAKAEVSLGQKFSRLNWTLTHYHSLAEDIIVNTQNAQNIMTSMNVGRSWIWGTVAEVTARSGGWEAGASVSQLSTVNLSEIPSQIGKSLPLRPSVELKSRLAWHTDRLRLEVSHTLYGPMALDAANRQELSMTHSLDLMTAYRLGVWGDLGLEITNLLDTVLATRVVGDYRFDAPTSGLLGYPAPGRRIGISWRIEL